MDDKLTRILSAIKWANTRGLRKITLNILPNSIVEFLEKMGYTVETEELNKQKFHIISWPSIPINFITVETTSYEECADDNQTFEWEKPLSKPSSKKTSHYFDSAKLSLLQIEKDLSYLFAELDD